jgi:hypothetical protein
MTISNPSENKGIDAPSTSLVPATRGPVVNSSDDDTPGERRLRVSPRLNKGMSRAGKKELTSLREKGNDKKLSVASDKQRRVSLDYKSQERAESVSQLISKPEAFGEESPSTHLGPVIRKNKARPKSESLTNSSHSIESEDATDWEVNSEEKYPIISTTSREMPDLQREQEDHPLIRQQMTRAKLQLVDRLMEEFWIVFNKDWKASSRQRGQTSAPATGSYATNSQTSPRKTNSRKRSLDRGDDQDPGDEDGRGSKRFGSALGSPAITNKVENYACPYRKHNPRKYCVKDWRSCCLTSQKTIARVK